MTPSSISDEYPPVSSPNIGISAVTHQARRSVARISGQRHGPITRLMSPGDLGQMLKPFIFLDYVDAHPHNWSSADGRKIMPMLGEEILSHA